MCLWKDPAALEEAANMARHCASMVPGEPHLVALVEEAGRSTSLLPACTETWGHG